MNEPFIEASGPSLGALAVYTRSNERDSVGNFVLRPVWRLYNHQGPDWQYAQALIREPTDTVSNISRKKSCFYYYYYYVHSF